MRWSPILTGELGQRALAAVADTVRQARRQRGGRPCVAMGLSGFALLLMETHRAQPRLASAADATAMVPRILRRLAALPLAPSLHEGYTGVGLTLELLRRAGLARVAGAADLDRALLARIEQFDRLPLTHAHLDLIGGLAGQGVYACARLPRLRPRRTAEAIVRWLDSRAVALPGGVSWLSPPRPHAEPGMLPGGIFDLGLAHGVPGILGFLARALEAGVAVRTTRRLLAAGTRWLLSQRKRRAGPAFDTYVPAASDADPAPTLPPWSSRLAWCYGDPGVAVALLAAARALDDREVHAVATETVHRIAAIRADPTVRDASLCHGTAGLLHVLNRIHQATGDPGCRAAAIHWAERTLDVRAGPDALTEKTPADGSRYHHLRFLVGAAGSALALLAAASATAPLWDRVMLLDLDPQ
jgi:hypothetical protein